MSFTPTEADVPRWGAIGFACTLAAVAMASSCDDPQSSSRGAAAPGSAGRTSSPDASGAGAESGALGETGGASQGGEPASTLSAIGSAGSPLNGAAGTSGATAAAGTSGAAIATAGKGGQATPVPRRCLGTGPALGAAPAEHGCIEPKIILSTPKPWGIALDHGNAYVTTADAQLGKVLRVHLESANDDGPLTIAENEAQPFDIAVASGTVFWCTNGGTGHVRKAPIDGGLVEDLAEGVVSGVGRVNADAQNAYYLTNYNIVMSVPVTGGPSTQLSAGPYNSNIMDLVLFENALFFTNNGVWDSKYTYKQSETATISTVSVTGTPPRSALVDRLSWPQFYVAADAQHVYFNDDKAIFSVDRGTGAVVTLFEFADVTIGKSAIVDLVSDGAHVYFADSTSVYRVPGSGGTVEAIAWGFQGIAQLTVDASTLAWTDNVRGVVVSLPKAF